MVNCTALAWELWIINMALSRGTSSSTMYSESRFPKLDVLSKSSNRTPYAFNRELIELSSHVLDAPACRSCSMPVDAADCDRELPADKVLIAIL